jgi:DNA primase
LRHPILLQEVDHAYAGLELDELLGQVRDALLDWAGRAERLDSADLMDHLTTSGLKANIEQVLAAEPGPLPACALPAAMPAEAEAGWWHIFGFLNVERLREEVAFARVEFERNPVPETQHRLVALAAALDKVQHGEPDGVELATI